MIIAAIVTPADPYSMFFALAFLIPIWMSIRWLISLRLSC